MRTISRTFKIPVVGMDLCLNALALRLRLLVPAPGAAARDALADHWQAHTETKALRPVLHRIRFRACQRRSA